MKRQFTPHRAGLVLLLAAGVALTGCEFLRRVFVGPSEETLWENDRHNAEFLAKRLLGEAGYYAKDSALNPEERGRLEANLNMLAGALKGPYSSQTERLDLEGRLVPHAKRYLAYVDKDGTFNDSEKREMKEPIEKWLRRIGIAP